MINRLFFQSPMRKKRLTMGILLFIAIFCIGCNPINGDSNIGTYIIASGKNPEAQKIVWSPTNADLVLLFSAGLPDSTAEISTYNIKTKKKTVIVKEQPAFLYDVVWAPDGNHILILSGPDMQGYQPHGWWLMNIEQGEKEYFCESGDVAFSPDGQIVAILREISVGDDSAGVQLLFLDVKTREEILVYSNPDADYSRGISWSPDGKSLVFSLGLKLSRDLYFWTAETNEVVKITKANRSDNPIWSPKGNIIAYLASGQSNVTETSLHLTVQNGSCDLIIPSIQYVKSVTWSPDGEKLAYINRDGIYYLEIDKVLGKDVYQDLCE